MSQQPSPTQSEDQAHVLTSSTIQEQISGIEDLMVSSCWLFLSPFQRQNWRRQLNVLRCRAIFSNAYSGHETGSSPSNTATAL